MLKSYFLGLVSSLILGSAAANTPVPHSSVPLAKPVAQARSVSWADGMGPPAPGSLRDTLRQTGEPSTQTSQPYRLSPQERQRLREQLRQQAVWPAQSSAR